MPTLAPNRMRERSLSLEPGFGASPSIRLPAALQAALGAAAPLEQGSALLCLRIDRKFLLGGESARADALHAARQFMARWQGRRSWLVSLHEGAWWVIVKDVDLRATLELAHGMVRSGRKLAFKHGPMVHRFGLSCGVAFSHLPNRPSLAGCFAVVSEGMRSATPGSVCVATHSHLYKNFVDASRAPVRPPLSPIEARSRLPLEPVDEPLPSLEEGGTPDELLERRLAKVTTALHDAEAEIERLRSHVASGEEGESSIYREVQGLKGRNQATTMKRAFLERMLQDNLELRDRVAREAIGRRN